MAELDGLSSRMAELWLTRGLDPEGGAYGYLDRALRPVFDAEGEARGPSGEIRGDKSLIQQARHTYSYSLLWERRGDERAKSAARHCQRFLFEAFARGRGSPFVHMVDRLGVVRETQTQLYAQGFAIYALSTYARVFEDIESGMEALALFERMDESLHDAEYGGYDQREDGGWLSFVDAPIGAVKCTNTHIHVLEALTPLTRFAPTHPARARLLELTRLLSTQLIQPSGYVHKFFAKDWAPVGPPLVSYGHDIETAWLLLDALDALVETGDVDESTRLLVKRAAVRMTTHALETGLDPMGGVFDEGVPLGQVEPAHVTRFEKVWWAQAEMLPGLVRIYLETHEERLLVSLEGAFEFLRGRLWDPECGEFFWGVYSDGSLAGRGDHKGEIWKTPYHALRACLLAADWIRSGCL